MIEPKWIDLEPEDLNNESRRRFGCAFSRQTINLKRKILEVHSEFFFMQMNNGVPQGYSKKNGMECGIG